MEFTLLWAALTAVAGLWLGNRLLRKSLPESTFDSLLASAVAGLAVGRVVAVISQGINPLTNLSDLLIVRGGVSTIAAPVAAIGTLYLMTGRKLPVLDAAAPVALLGLAGWHMGCVWRGACLGTASQLPWAWAEPASTITRHPVEIYTGVALVIGAWIVHRLPRDPGLRTGIALALASAIRLATEPVRLSIGGGPYLLYAAGTVIGVAVALSALLIKRAST